MAPASLQIRTKERRCRKALNKVFAR